MPPYASPSAYRANQVLTASSEQLIVMLYDGARRFLLQAAVAMEATEIPLAHTKLRRAEHIVRHLRNTVDPSFGEVAGNLRSLYVFWLGHMAQARIHQDPARLREVADMVGRLRESWAQIADGQPAAAAPAAAVVA